LNNGAWQPGSIRHGNLSVTAARAYSSIPGPQADNAGNVEAAPSGDLFRITPADQPGRAGAFVSADHTSGARQPQRNRRATHFSFERSRVCRLRSRRQSAGFFHECSSRSAPARSSAGLPTPGLISASGHRVLAGWTVRYVTGGGPEQHLALQQGWRPVRITAPWRRFPSPIYDWHSIAMASSGHYRRRSAGPARPQYRRHHRELQRWHRTGLVARSELGYPLRLNRKRHRTVQYGDHVFQPVSGQRVNGLAMAPNGTLWAQPGRRTGRSYFR